MRCAGGGGRAKDIGIIPGRSRGALPISLSQWNKAFEMYISGRECWLSVASNSMTPTLIKGDRVLIKPCSHDQVSPGDIVLCRVGKMLRVHRLVGWVKDDPQSGGDKLIITCGDQYMRCDAPISAEAIQGQIIKRRRGKRETDLCSPSARIMGKLFALRGKLSYTFIDTQI